MPAHKSSSPMKKGESSTGNGQARKTLATSISSLPPEIVERITLEVIRAHFGPVPALPGAQSNYSDVLKAMLGLPRDGDHAPGCPNAHPHCAPHKPPSHQHHAGTPAKSSSKAQVDAKPNGASGVPKTDSHPSPASDSAKPSTGSDPSAVPHGRSAPNGPSKATPQPPQAGAGATKAPEKSCPCYNCRGLEVTWPDGLPHEPLLPLALVNRTFLAVSRDKLYAENAFVDIWTLSLFLRSIASPCVDPPTLIDDTFAEPVVADPKGKRRAGTVAPAKRRDGTLADLVRSLSFLVKRDGKSMSMGRGGGRVLCDAIAACPRLEELMIAAPLLAHCKQPLYASLAKQSNLRLLSLALASPTLEEQVCPLDLEDVVRQLLSTPNYSKLVTFDATGMQGLRVPMTSLGSHLPDVKCGLTTVSLLACDLIANDILILLKASASTLLHFSLKVPSSRMSRPALFMLLKSLPAKLKVLALSLNHNWNPIQPALKQNGAPVGVTSTDPAKSPFILDSVFKSGGLRNLMTLCVGGDGAISSNALPWLPESLEMLAWDECRHMRPLLVAAFITSWRTRRHGNRPASAIKPATLINRPAPQFTEDGLPIDKVAGLPNLFCLSVDGDCADWSNDSWSAIDKAVAMRDICFHPNSAATWPNGSSGMRKLTGPPFNPYNPYIPDYAYGDFDDYDGYDGYDDYDELGDYWNPFVDYGFMPPPTTNVGTSAATPSSTVPGQAGQPKHVPASGPTSTAAASSSASKAGQKQPNGQPYAFGTGQGSNFAFGAAASPAPTGQGQGKGKKRGKGGAKGHAPNAPVAGPSKQPAAGPSHQAAAGPSKQAGAGPSKQAAAAPGKSPFAGSSKQPQANASAVGGTIDALSNWNSAALLGLPYDIPAPGTFGQAYGAPAPTAAPATASSAAKGKAPGPAKSSQAPAPKPAAAKPKPAAASSSQDGMFSAGSGFKFGNLFGPAAASKGKGSASPARQPSGGV